MSHRLLRRIIQLVTPKDFAYPCGLKFVGRGSLTKCYVPLIAQRLLSGRGYLDEAPKDPAFVDLAQAMRTPLDDLDFEHMKKLVEDAAKNGSWIIFVGHDMGARGYQTTDLDALARLCAYLKDPANGIDHIPRSPRPSPSLLPARAGAAGRHPPCSSA